MNIVSKLKNAKARFDAFPLSGKIAAAALAALALSALGFNLSMVGFIAGLL